jgi:hypothetical protein
MWYKMLDSLLHHWMLLTGITSATIGLILLVVLVPTAGPILAEFLKPIASALGNWIGLWMTDLATGLRLMLTSVAGVIFCLSVFVGGMAVGHFYFASPATHAVELAMLDLHKNFRCVPRTSGKVGTSTWYNPFSWF